MVNINQRPKGEIAVMMATHNEDTVRFVINKSVLDIFNVAYLKVSTLSNFIKSTTKLNKQLNSINNFYLTCI